MRRLREEHQPLELWPSLQFEAGRNEDSPTRTGCIRSCPTRPLTIWAKEALVPSPAPC